MITVTYASAFVIPEHKLEETNPRNLSLANNPEHHSFIVLGATVSN